MDENLIADLRDSYGIACGQAAPVAGGWLNLKWRVSTGEGELLVKQFDPNRFPPSKLEPIEAALQRQIFARECGVPCPSILTRAGRAIRLWDGGAPYMVMEFLPGRSETPDTVTTRQMRSLGDACGRMHAAFSRLPREGVKGCPLDGARVHSDLWANFRARAGDCAPEHPAGYRDAVRALEPILRKLTPEFLERLPMGIAHEDFSGDNILFSPDGVSAIVDFDRGQYGFLWHDVGRALLSLAWRDGVMDMPRVRAFLGGYALHMPPPDAAAALRVAWCVEVPWWIQPEFFTSPHAKTARFRDEMLWLTEHWDDLDILMA